MSLNEKTLKRLKSLSNEEEKAKKKLAEAKQKAKELEDSLMVDFAKEVMTLLGTDDLQEASRRANEKLGHEFNQ